ncbi:hypothetical protein [Neolewinella antarctica]|uniref:ELWxxDGT repeat protein n=1 Tax=Neolewinella antarctica TaxID=442734 RepID=A0ABX0XEJ1_9BACT|nr:hypothetical protein [Neolewinella antarctica]NJC27622.1 ELWxxDGT repeat protein [Neolewinella antarctica]
MKQLLLFTLSATLYVASLTGQGKPKLWTNLDIGNNATTSIGSIYGFGSNVIATARQNDPDAGDGPYFLIDPVTGNRTNLVEPNESITENLYGTRDQGLENLEFVETNGELYAFRNEPPTAVYRYEDGRFNTFVQGTNLRYENLAVNNGTAYIVAADYDNGQFYLLSSDGTADGTRVLGSVPAVRSNLSSVKCQLETNETGLLFTVTANSNTEHLYGYQFATESLTAITFLGEDVALSSSEFSGSGQRTRRTLAYHDGHYYFWGFSSGGSQFLKINAATFVADTASIPQPAGSDFRFRQILFLNYGDELIAQVDGVFSSHQSPLVRLNDAGEWVPLPGSTEISGPVASPFVHDNVAYFTNETGDSNFELLAYDGDRLRSVASYEGNSLSYEIYPAGDWFFVAENSDYNLTYTALDLTAGTENPPSITTNWDRYSGLGAGTTTTVGESLIFFDDDGDGLRRWTPGENPAPTIIPTGLPIINDWEEPVVNLLGHDPVSEDVIVFVDEYDIIAISQGGETTNLDPDEAFNLDSGDKFISVSGRLFIRDFDAGTLEHVAGALREPIYSIPARNYTGPEPELSFIQQIAPDRYVAQVLGDLRNETGSNRAFVDVAADALTVTLLPGDEVNDFFFLSVGNDPAYFQSAQTSDAAGTYRHTVTDADGAVLFTFTDPAEFFLDGVDDSYFYLKSSTFIDQTELLVFNRLGTVGSLAATIAIPDDFEEVNDAAPLGGSLLLTLRRSDGRSRFYLAQPATETLEEITMVLADPFNDLTGGALPITGRSVFPGLGGGIGLELFASDGTIAGTTLLADINPGSARSDPDNFVGKDGFVFFSATGPSGNELYRVTPAGTVELLADIFPGVRSGSPRDLLFSGDDLFFMARNPADKYVEVYQLPLALMTSTETFATTPPLVFPNPVGQGTCTVRAPEGLSISHVEVYAADGRSVLARRVSDAPSVSLQLAGLPPGQYWLRTRYTDGRVSISGVVR